MEQKSMEEILIIISKDSILTQILNFLRKVIVIYTALWKFNSEIIKTLKKENYDILLELQYITKILQIDMPNSIISKNFTFFQQKIQKFQIFLKQCQDDIPYILANGIQKEMCFNFVSLDEEYINLNKKYMNL